MNAALPQYVIITPARDEAEYIERTIASVATQTVLPLQWIIVNDGSKDRTGEIIDAAAKLYPWITVRHRSDRGFRQAGGGVVKTFNDGYEAITSSNWDFLVKLDADLSFGETYFAQCFAEFTKDQTLGICGGGIYHNHNGNMELEKNPRFHVRGATKIYRRACWDTLGGLVQAPGWDTLDELKANMLGWTTRTLPDLRLSHYRFTGAADGSWKDCVKNGRANYVTGYHPLFMLVKFLRRLFARPYLIGAFGLLWGFVSGYLKHIPQVQDRTLIQYIRGQQLRRLMLQESIWR